jgi:hypothetical protein
LFYGIFLGAQNPSLCSPELGVYEGFIPYKKNKSWGYVNYQNELIHPAKLDTGFITSIDGTRSYSLRRNAFLLQRGNQLGLVAQNYYLKPAIREMWTVGDYYLIKNKKGKFGLLSDVDGTHVLDTRYDNIQFYRGGYLNIRIKNKEGLSYFTNSQADTDLLELLPIEYDSIKVILWEDTILAYVGTNVTEYIFDLEKKSLNRLMSYGIDEKTSAIFEKAIEGSQVAKIQKGEYDEDTIMEGGGDRLSSPRKKRISLTYVGIDSIGIDVTKVYDFNFLSGTTISDKPPLTSSIKKGVHQNINYISVEKYSQNDVIFYSDSLELISYLSRSAFLFKSESGYYGYAIKEGRAEKIFTLPVEIEILGVGSKAIAGVPSVIYQQDGQDYIFIFNFLKATTFEFCKKIENIQPAKNVIRIRFENEIEYSLLYFDYDLWEPILSPPMMKENAYFEIVSLSSSITELEKKVILVRELDEYGNFLHYIRFDGLRLGE